MKEVNKRIGKAGKEVVGLERGRSGVTCPVPVGYRKVEIKNMMAGGVGGGDFVGWAQPTRKKFYFNNKS